MPSIKEILLDINSDPSGARRGLGETAAELAAFEGQKATAHLDIDRAGLEASLAHVEQELDRLDRRRVNPAVRLKVEGLRGDAAMIRAEMTRLHQSLDRDMKLGGRMGDDSAMQRFRQGMRDVERDAGKLSDQLTNLADNGLSAAEGGSVNMGLSLARLLPVVMGVAVIVGVVLVSALGALVASAAAAAAGVAALAITLVAALGPAVVVVAAMMSRIAAIMQVYQARQSASVDASKQGAMAADQLGAAHERQLTALNGVRDATQQVTRARRELAAAETTARQNIANAQIAARETQHNLVLDIKAERDAIGDLATARKKAADDWIDALDRVKDSQRAVRASQLDLAGAVLDLSDAQKAWNQAIGLIPQDKLNTLLQKLKDVSLDPSQVTEAFGSALGQTAGTDPNKVARAWLNLQKALLAVDNATNGVGDANRQLARDQNDVAAGQQKYISQHPAMVAAQDAIARAHERVRDARTRAAAAQRTLTQLEAAGVARAPGVISGQEAVRNSLERLVQARHQLAIATRAAASGTGALSSSAATAGAKFGMLSAAEQRFLLSLERFVRVVRSALGPAMGQVFDALGGGLGAIGRMLRILQPFFTMLGGAMARSITMFVRALTSPVWVTFFAQMIVLSSRVLPILTPGIIALADIFRNIATAAAPLLVSFLRQVVTWLQGIARSTGNMHSLGALLNLFVDSLRAWLGLAGALARIFGAFLGDAATKGNELVRWLTAGANALAKWVDSKQGRDMIRQFFTDTLPLAKELIPVILKFGLVFLRVLQLVTPLLIGVFRAAGGVADAILWLAGVLIDATRPFRGLLILIGEIIGSLVGGAGLGAALRWIGGRFSWLLGSVGKVGDWLGGIGSAIASFASHVFGAARNLGGSILSGLARGVGSLADAVTGWFEKAWNSVLRFFGVRSPSTLAAELGRAIVDGLIRGIKLLPGLLLSAGRWIFDKIKAGVSGVVGGALSLGKDIVTSILDGVQGKSNEVTAAGRDVASKIGTGVGQVDLSGAGAAASGQITAGLNAVGIGAGIPGAIGQGIAAASAAVGGGTQAVLGAINRILGSRAYSIAIRAEFVGATYRAAQATMARLRTGIAQTRAAANRMIWIRVNYSIVNAAIRAMDQLKRGAQEVANAIGRIKWPTATHRLAISGVTGLDAALADATPDIAMQQVDAFTAATAGLTPASVGSPAVPTFVGGGGGGTKQIIENVNMKLELPKGATPDPRTAALLVMEHIRNRGGVRR